MKIFTVIALALCILSLTCALAIAGDVYVKGYTKKDGTYVQPYVRSSPDSYRYNNYGPSSGSSEYMNPRARDNDASGMPNYLDRNDDNDAYQDDNDSNQYGR